MLKKKLIKDNMCEVSEVTLSTMLNGLCKCGNVVNAVMLLEVLEQMDFLRMGELKKLHYSIMRWIERDYIT
ncbi:hypothetical protein Leryth_026528 [Lithospermum erythrorhizon]|nr:hypothetical protein Leryth_026528 [Lithospermum erythrorhizon]